MFVERIVSITLNSVDVICEILFEYFVSVFISVMNLLFTGLKAGANKLFLINPAIYRGGNPLFLINIENRFNGF